MENMVLRINGMKRRNFCKAYWNHYTSYDSAWKIKFCLVNQVKEGHKCGKKYLKKSHKVY
jgi:hypothetical protein